MKSLDFVHSVLTNRVPCRWTFQEVSGEWVCRHRFIVSHLVARQLDNTTDWDRLKLEHEAQKWKIIKV